eukprot:1519344-Pleurochrysis_carterae.AAC.1
MAASGSWVRMFSNVFECPSALALFSISSLPRWAMMGDDEYDATVRSRDGVCASGGQGGVDRGWRRAQGRGDRRGQPGLRHSCAARTVPQVGAAQLGKGLLMRSSGSGAVSEARRKGFVSLQSFVSLSQGELG